MTAAVGAQHALMVLFRESAPRSVPIVQLGARSRGTRLLCPSRTATDCSTFAQVARPRETASVPPFDQSHVHRGDGSLPSPPQRRTLCAGLARNVPASSTRPPCVARTPTRCAPSAQRSAALSSTRRRRARPPRTDCASRCPLAQRGSHSPRQQQRRRQTGDAPT